MHSKFSLRFLQVKDYLYYEVLINISSSTTETVSFVVRGPWSNRERNSSNGDVGSGWEIHHGFQLLISPCKKTDGSNRLCVDFRWLYYVPVAGSAPILRIDESVAQDERKRILSKLDKAKDYRLIRMGEEPKEKAAHSFGSRIDEFQFLPFGMKTAAGTFTKWMRRVWEGQCNTEHYVDDVFVASNTCEFRYNR